MRLQELLFNSNAHCLYQLETFQYVMEILLNIEPSFEHLSMAWKTRPAKLAFAGIDCLYFLEQFTRGQPRELVHSCQHMFLECGYVLAKKLQNEHFGNSKSLLHTPKELWLGLQSNLRTWRHCRPTLCSSVVVVTWWKNLNICKSWIHQPPWEQ